ncbi:MAG TPA: hypothetical protein VEY93_03370, partial [Longimicrobium sp.]|nr:hypothetical protein [Longimicrobium sp.]
DPLDAPDLMGGELRPGDLLMLCSDGLTGMLTDRQLGRILSIPSTPEEHVDRLIRAANARGGRDNITAVVVEILPSPDAAPEDG